MITFDGTPEFQGRLKEIILNFSDCFSTTLNKEPARIEPMDLDVDIAKWRVPKNSGPPRPQTPEKQKEIIRQTSDLVEAGVTPPSTLAFIVRSI
jgi:hypothetical protein